NRKVDKWWVVHIRTAPLKGLRKIVFPFCVFSGLQSHEAEGPGQNHLLKNQWLLKSFCRLPIPRCQRRSGKTR
ncbi:hypothetical protein, partial [Heyndrickxia coagulans]|uniref:hypothetical protein n=1 Tax=Heyndrickxia coagulans TaxID=1398 RepID=UPI001E4A6C57